MLPQAPGHAALPVPAGGAGPLLYRLYTMLVDARRSCHSGHYFCSVQVVTGRWFKLDDAQVTAYNASVALSQRAYVLFVVQTSELEGDSREACCPGSEHKVAASTPQGTRLPPTSRPTPGRSRHLTLPSPEEVVEGGAGGGVGRRLALALQDQ